MARAKGKRVTMPDGTVHVAAKAPNGEGSIYAVAEGGYKATYVDPRPAAPRPKPLPAVTPGSPSSAAPHPAVGSGSTRRSHLWRHGGSTTSPR